MGQYNRKQFKNWKPGDVVKSKTVPTGQSLTKQEFAKESDINVMMDRALKTGQMPVGAPDKWVFADVSNVGTFQDMLSRVDLARASFAALPAKVRSRFQNNPVALIEFLQDRSNYDEAVKLGLIEKKEAPPAPEETPKESKKKAPKEPEKP